MAGTWNSGSLLRCELQDDMRGRGTSRAWPKLFVARGWWDKCNGGGQERQIVIQEPVLLRSKILQMEEQLIVVVLEI